jgi:putative nucleotidyltransferase with HDIG domain
MAGKIGRGVFRELSRVRPGLLLLVVFLVLLGLVNWLVVNQKVVLYVFYVPVVFAAWLLPKRDAVSVAILAAMMVVAFAFFIPGKLATAGGHHMLWAELGIWGGILVVTAYMVALLRAWTMEAMRNLQRAYGGVLSILSKFIQTVDADTEAHSTRVSAWSVRLAEELGLSKALVEETRIASLLHDVGKVDVSVELLRKAAELSDEEVTQVRQHTIRGAAMIKPVGGMLSHIADAIESHHEKYDGSGYKGLKAEQIPLVARIIAVTDAFDALLSDRPYRKGVGIFEAMDAIIASSATHFDPKIVAALKKIVDREGERAVPDVPYAHIAR